MSKTATMVHQTRTFDKKNASILDKTSSKFKFYKHKEPVIKAPDRSGSLLQSSEVQCPSTFNSTEKTNVF